MLKDTGRRKKMASDEEIEKAFASVKITLVRDPRPVKKPAPKEDNVALMSGIGLSNIGR